jgi:hypothetical protein
VERQESFSIREKVILEANRSSSKKVNPTHRHRAHDSTTTALVVPKHNTPPREDIHTVPFGYRFALASVHLIIAINLSFASSSEQSHREKKQ